ncbi:MAG TPA: hypothetical protein VF271_01025 [Rhodanobacteraceae bacterium]
MGCLPIIALFVIGTGLGYWLGGAAGATWGAGIGIALGIILGAALVLFLRRAQTDTSKDH